MRRLKPVRLACTQRTPNLSHAEVVRPQGEITLSRIANKISVVPESNGFTACGEVGFEPTEELPLDQLTTKIFLEPWRGFEPRSARLQGEASPSKFPRHK